MEWYYWLVLALVMLWMLHKVGVPVLAAVQFVAEGLDVVLSVVSGAGNDHSSDDGFKGGSGGGSGGAGAGRDF